MGKRLDFFDNILYNKKRKSVLPKKGFYNIFDKGD